MTSQLNQADKLHTVMATYNGTSPANVDDRQFSMATSVLSYIIMTFY